MPCTGQRTEHEGESGVKASIGPEGDGSEFEAGTIHSTKKLQATGGTRSALRRTDRATGEDESARGPAAGETGTEGLVVGSQRPGNRTRRSARWAPTARRSRSTEGLQSESPAGA